MIESNSVGVVTPETFHYTEPFTVSCGRTLNGFDIVYETYGTLNTKKNNAVLICHALSGDHHAAGVHDTEDKKPGWWDHYIGPGKAIDTNHFFVVSLNNLGGCSGSTGPLSINPETQQPWGPSFPVMRVRDWVASQKLLMESLGIPGWVAVIGGSLGGMQAMRWSLEFPKLVKHCVVIASALKLTAQNIGFNDTARTAITSDPEFHDGKYYEKGVLPRQGLSIARMIGHITYLSSDVMGEKFGRELREGTFQRGIETELKFEVESYLRYQGEKFSEQFDANTYLLMLRALDFFDLAREYDDKPVEAFSRALSKFFVISFSTDWRFSPERSQEIVNALIQAKKQVSYVEINSDFGHDSFLLPIPRYEQVFKTYMERVAIECGYSEGV